MDASEEMTNLTAFLFRQINEDQLREILMKKVEAPLNDHGSKRIDLLIASVCGSREIFERKKAELALELSIFTNTITAEFNRVMSGALSDPEFNGISFTAIAKNDVDFDAVD